MCIILPLAQTNNKNKSKFNLFLLNWTWSFSVLIAWGFILCCDVCSAPHSQCDCVPGPIWSKARKTTLCNNVTFTLLPEQPAAFEWPCKWNGGGGSGGGGAGSGLVTMGACILTAKPRWFDWGPWQWTALTFDPAQAVSLYHSQTHLREPRLSRNSLRLDL